MPTQIPDPGSSSMDASSGMLTSQAGMGPDQTMGTDPVAGITDGSAPKEGWPSSMLPSGGSEGPDDYKNRLNAVKSKIEGIRQMLPQMMAVAHNVKTMNRDARISALNMIFAMVTNMGYDLTDPRDMTRFQQDLAETDPQLPQVLDGILAALDPSKVDSAPPDLSKYGNSSMMTDALSARHAEDLGWDFSQPPQEEAPPGQAAQ